MTDYIWAAVLILFWWVGGLSQLVSRLKPEIDRLEIRLYKSAEETEYRRKLNDENMELLQREVVRLNSVLDARTDAQKRKIDGLEKEIERLRASA